MIDHHVTALHFNEYEWGDVQTEYEAGKKTCASLLFYEYLINEQYIKPQKSLDDLKKKAARIP